MALKDLLDRVEGFTGDAKDMAEELLKRDIPVGKVTILDKVIRFDFADHHEVIVRPVDSATIIGSEEGAMLTLRKGRVSATAHTDSKEEALALAMQCVG